ncbi:MAG: hypothetical protein ACREN6_07955, partial [Gemmatimonadaceae bacterium]
MRILKALLWACIALLGAGAFAVLALQHGEHVSAGWLLTAAICTYAIAYRFYSKIIETKIFMLN